MNEGLEDELINLLKDREEVASKFRDRIEEKKWEEKALDLIIEWWALSTEIDDVKKKNSEINHEIWRGKEYADKKLVI